MLAFLSYPMQILLAGSLSCTCSGLCTGRSRSAELVELTTLLTLLRYPFEIPVMGSLFCACPDVWQMLVS